MAGKLPGRAISNTATITVAAITVGNAVVNSSIIALGNSTVNTYVNSSSVSTVVLNVGSNVFVNTSTIHLGNSIVNTVIHTTGFTGNGAGLHSVNAAALEGNTVANILTAANTAANTLANAAYSNAVSYAASNTYVNNTFLPLAGGTITGTIAVGNSTVNSVVNSTSASLGNTTINGFVNVSSNLTVTSVAAFGNNVTITGNLIVTGTRIFANTTTVDLSDNIITLNADIGQVTPSENAGLEVHRGTSANVQFVWNETIDKWTFTTDGTNYVTVASNNDVTTAYSNAIAYSGNAALAYANAIAYAASNSYVNSTFAPLSGAAFTGAVSGITTLAAGNTTITGLINVSTNTATFGTALYVVANGNVGIGTASPATRFHVYASGGGLELNPAANTTLEFIDRANTNATVNTLLYTRNGFFAFYTGGYTERLRILNNGKVGIGTDTPSDILTVDSTTADSYIRMNSSNVGNTGIKISYSNSSAHGMDIFYYPNNAQCYFDSKYQVNAGSVYGDIYFRQNVAGTMTTRMTIKGDGGNVGIGNTSPASKLTVTTNSANSGYQTALDFASIGLQIESANATGQGVVAFTFGGTVRSTVRADYAGNLVLSPKSGDIYYGFDASGANTVQHRFYSNSSTTSVLFAANGNVGIGTTSPGTKFHVVSTDAITGAWTRTAIFQAAYPVLVFHSTSGQNKFGGIGYDSGTAEGWRFWGNASTSDVSATTPLFNILNNGNVSVLGTLTENSSILIKENIKPIYNALNIISKLVGVTYDRKDGSATQRPGLIAEEVDKILPNIVVKNENGAPSSIAYTNLIAYLVESIKELKAEIDVLKSK